MGRIWQITKLEDVRKKETKQPFQAHYESPCTELYLLLLVSMQSVMSCLCTRARKWMFNQHSENGLSKRINAIFALVFDCQIN